jgi:hypothetical protein
MSAQKSTQSAVVDLFYAIGASRGGNIIPAFESAYQQDSDLALRIAMWARDVRGGAGERQLFRDILMHLEKTHREDLLNTKILNKVPELGRWDDLLIFTDMDVKSKAYGLIAAALRAGNGLCAKWMPRKGKIAVELRNALGLSPKAYRKLLVNNTNVVETPMCAKTYDRIEYKKVPSLAMSRYTKAFERNDGVRFREYVAAVQSGEVKVNAGAVYPYDIIKTINYGGGNALANEQWKALPDYVNGSLVLPMVDVSGSMQKVIGNNKNLTCMDVAVSLGLYLADKNKGPFEDMFLSFSHDADINVLKGTLSEKLTQIQTAEWGMNTNLHAAFDRILEVAVRGDAHPKDMPQVLIIFSDMQFDECVEIDDSAMQMIRRKYAESGYEVPVVVFWNLNARRNVPVSFDETGVVLVSGFSPSILKSILSADFQSVTPLSVVCDTVRIPRYDYF